MLINLQLIKEGSAFYEVDEEYIERKRQEKKPEEEYVYGEQKEDTD